MPDHPGSGDPASDDRPPALSEWFHGTDEDGSEFRCSSCGEIQELFKPGIESSEIAVVRCNNCDEKTTFHAVGA